MADVLDAIKPTLFVSRVIGIAPFTLDSQQNRLKVSKICLIFSVAILIVYTGVSSYGLYQMISWEKSDNNGMFISDANRICQMACGAGVTVITLLLALIQRNKFIEVVHSIYCIDKDMAKLRLPMPYENIIRMSWIFNGVLITVLIILCIHDNLVWYFYDDDDYGFDIQLCSTLANVFNFIMELQFISGALLVKKHFSVLNDYLLKLYDSEEGIGPSVEARIKELTDSYVEGVDKFLGPKLLDPKLVPWDGNFTRFQAIKTVATSGVEKESKLSRIKSFRKLHSNLCDVKETLNMAFSLQLLASVAQAFVIITSDLYMLFTTISDTKPAELGYITYPIVWSVTHVMELVFVVVTCTKTSKKANQTAIVVHKLLARDCEQDVRNQLKLFSIQLLHRKISFSACGFFTLDMTLLQAIIGAATTYLVILIQFHNTYEKGSS